MLLTKLNYKVNIIKHEESGRALLSKGFLEGAKKVANKNVSIFKDLVSESTPLIGIEPSAILTFKDEYLKLWSSDAQSILQSWQWGDFKATSRGIIRSNIDSHAVTIFIKEIPATGWNSPRK